MRVRQIVQRHDPDTVTVPVEHDAVPVVEHGARQEEAVGLRPAAVLTDGAFGTADARADMGALGIEVVAKLRPLKDQAHIGKDARAAISDLGMLKTAFQAVMTATMGDASPSIE